MKHPSNKDLFAYWNKQRGERLAPSRADIEPTDIRHVLGDAFVLATDSAGNYSFRLAGTLRMGSRRWSTWAPFFALDRPRRSGRQAQQNANNRKNRQQKEKGRAKALPWSHPTLFPEDSAAR